MRVRVPAGTIIARGTILGSQEDSPADETKQDQGALVFSHHPQQRPWGLGLAPPASKQQQRPCQQPTLDGFGSTALTFA